MAKKKTTKAKQLPLVPKASKETKPKAAKSTAKFVSLSVMAVIPTQSYGNIQPRIEVTAANFADAKAFAMERIAEFYEYAETKPSFLGKIEVKEKVIAAPSPKVEEPVSPSSVAPSAPSSSTSTSTPEVTTPKPEPVLKAEKAIGLAATEEAATLIQDQIEKSVKIPQEFKQGLLELCLNKRGELSKKSGK